MSREDLVQYPTLEALAVLERGITAICSVFNALYFAGYRSGLRRRRVGALVLLVVNLAFLVQSLYFGLLPYFTRLDLVTLIANPGLRLAAGLLPLVASFLITLLILRQLLARRRDK